MKRYLVSFLLILSSTITVGLASAYAGTVQIGPLTILRIDDMGVTWGSQTAGNIEIKIQTGFLPAGLACTDGQFLTTKASDMTASEFALIMLARQNNTPIYLWISDDSTHSAIASRCSIFAVEY